MLREKQFRIGFIIAVLAAMVLLAGSALAAKDGWVTKDGKTFYYTDDRRGALPVCGRRRYADRMEDDGRRDHVL